MGLHKLQIPTQLLFTQIAVIGGRRILAWNARSPRLLAPNAYRNDSQLVSDFRTKLRQTEDLISKLGYSLREIYCGH